jgi:hypothetical protein
VCLQRSRRSFYSGVTNPIDPELIQLQRGITVAGTNPLYAKKGEHKSPHVVFESNKSGFWIVSLCPVDRCMHKNS